jgi:hypothetical protein
MYHAHNNLRLVSEVVELCHGACSTTFKPSSLRKSLQFFFLQKLLLQLPIPQQLPRTTPLTLDFDFYERFGPFRLPKLHVDKRSNYLQLDF